MSNWFITGISRGFGKALCEAVLQQGHRVVGTTRNGQCDFAHERLVVLPLDVTNETQVEDVMKQAIAALNHINVVVNNAGFGMVGAVEEVSTQEANRVFDTNFYGTFHVIRAALPYLRARQAGHIVNFSSVGGMTGSAGFGLYNAAKFAVEGLSEALAIELKPFGVHVTIVEPGYFRTEFLSQESIVKSAKVVEAYAETAGVARGNIAARDGFQAGDPAKAAQVIMAAVADPAPPLRLPLGADCFARIDAKLQRLHADMAAWRERACDTRFDE